LETPGQAEALAKATAPSAVFVPSAPDNGELLLIPYEITGQTATFPCTNGLKDILGFDIPTGPVHQPTGERKKFPAKAQAAFVAMPLFALHSLGCATFGGRIRDSELHSPLAE
jgi:hypothetical protein